MTCRKCHAQANAEFSQGKIHVAPDGAAAGTDFGSRLNNWVRRIYLFLIFATIGGMFAHNFIIFVKKVAARLRHEERPVVRMSNSQRWQHLVLATSFIVLAVTGFALKFPDSWLSKTLGSNEPFRRWTHRIAGIILMVVEIYHLVYQLAARDGRKLVAVATTIHYYEAVLAGLAIIVWHFYHVIFGPDVYPINTAGLDGRISEEFQAHEHPLERPEAKPRRAPPGEDESGKEI
ncbi:MAG TPA: DUF4405 domain-containing protein [Verrucomicrobiae bacterium]